MAEIVCPHCHFPLPATGAFCPGCGSFVGSGDAADIHQRAVHARSRPSAPSTELSPGSPVEEPVVAAQQAASPASNGDEPPAMPAASRRPVRRRSADPYPSDTTLGRPDDERRSVPDPSPDDRSPRRGRAPRGAALSGAAERTRARCVAIAQRTAGAGHRLGLMPVVVGLVVAALLVSGGVYYLSGDAGDVKRSQQPDPVRLVALGKPDATCAARASVNASGEKVMFGPRHLVDGKTATAWRCAGDGSKQKVTFTLPRRVRVTKLALVPGWATKDEKSKANRFAENGAPTAVTWRLAGHRVEQRIGKPEPTWSSVRPKSPVSAREITLTIDSIRKGNRRDMVAVSEVRVYGH